MRTNVKKDELVASRVPRELVNDLKRIEKIEHLDRSTNIRRLLYSGVQEWKLAHAARLYAEGRMTVGGAAREAGMSVREMMDYLSENRIPYQYDQEEFSEDLQQSGIRRRATAARAAQRKRAPKTRSM